MRAPFMDFGARLSGMVHAELCPPEALVPYFAHNARLDLRMYLALVESMQRHDATDQLPGIAVPTLVVAGDRDQLTPLACAQEMARLIPGAELFVIPDGTHAALVEQPLLLALRVRQFLEERVAS
jgi:pimeloyl-ACP methyl ester carboxylesterase